MKNETKNFQLEHKALITEAKKMFYSNAFARKLIKEFKNMLYLYKKINYDLFAKIFNKFKHEFSQIFIHLSPKTLFSVFDEDGDGFLNEDELILIFSLIRSKMCHLDQELICEGFYKISTKLKSCIVNLSDVIFEFQSFLREKLYKSQLEKFENIIGNSFFLW